jgi:ankyrin repeat protein
MRLWLFLSKDVNAYDENGGTVFFLVASNYHLQYVKMLLEAKSDVNGL